MATTYQTPGVYIEEFSSGPKPITGASTSVLAIVGRAARGPYMDPTRVISWADFQAQFGSVIAGSWMAEAVYGFFTNGGPAAWIVRADPSALATWNVNNASGTTLFELHAASPGAWANGYKPIVFWSRAGGSGKGYAQKPTQTPALGGATATIRLTTTAGLKPGDAVKFVDVAGNQGTATVNTVQPDLITVQSLAAGSVTAADAWLIHVYPQTATTTKVFLPTANGFKPGDVLDVQAPNGNRAHYTITAAVNNGAGMDLELASAVTAVDAASYQNARAWFPATITATATAGQVAAGELTFDHALVRVTDVVAGFGIRQGDRAGHATANGGPFRLPGAVAGSTVSVENVHRVGVYQQEISISGTGAEVLAQLAEEITLLPNGEILTLVPSDASGNVDVTWDSGTGAYTGTVPAGKTWLSATFKLDVNIQTGGVLVRSPAAPAAGQYVRFTPAGAGSEDAEITKVTSKGGDVYLLEFAAALSTVTPDPALDASFVLRDLVHAKFSPLRFGLSIEDAAGDAVEQFDNLSLSASHPFTYTKEGVINEVSTVVAAQDLLAPGTVANFANLPAAVAVKDPGADAAPTWTDLRDGFTALEKETEPAIVACPDALELGDDLLTAQAYGAMITHCETYRRYAIVDAPDIENSQDLADWRLTNVASTYAGVYAPFVKAANLAPNPDPLFVQVPPSGYVAGVFARTDSERGVWKAPANEAVRGIVGLGTVFTKGHQDLLNPNGVNLIRPFLGRGIRVWGARNATDDIEWRYVNVRRLFLFLENSIERGTQWVVFEPNIDRTWLRVRVSVENFLDGVWRAGGLAGTKPEQAYRVRVGLGQTMTEDDIANGLMIIEVAVAPAKPAEFVVFRFTHKRLAE